MRHVRAFWLLVATGSCCSLLSFGIAFQAVAAHGLHLPGAPAPSTPTATVAETPVTPTPTAELSPAPAPRGVAGAQATPSPAASEDEALIAAPEAASAADLAASYITSSDTMAAGLLALMNGARAEAGLDPLSPSSELADVALARARDLIAKGYFDHYGADGESAFSELAARGIHYRLAGENLARNNYPAAQTVEEAFNSLMASAGHRANILESHFSRAGVAAVQAGKVWLYVTVFMD